MRHLDAHAEMPWCFLLQVLQPWCFLLRIGCRAWMRLSNWWHVESEEHVEPCMRLCGTICMHASALKQIAWKAHGLGKDEICTTVVRKEQKRNTT
eukprot:1140884-Pelagomonas_calceolata.AAC.4